MINRLDALARDAIQWDANPISVEMIEANVRYAATFCGANDGAIDKVIARLRMDFNLY